jgi:predicted transposase YbfD/YdcC
VDEFEACFASLTDRRVSGSVKYRFIDLLYISFATVLSGGEGYSDMARFVRAKEKLMRKRLCLPVTLPSHDVFRELYSWLDPSEFNACFMGFSKRFAGVLVGVVALDGKTLCGSAGSGGFPIHVVNAWAKEARIVLGQLATEAKSNEITAVPRLLDLLSINGCIVTVDAMNTQRATAEKIIECGADYVLALKGNQKSLFEDVKLAMEDPETTVESGEERVDSGHGRIETRVASVCTDVSFLDDHEWPWLAAIGKIVRTREFKAIYTRQVNGTVSVSNKKTETETVYHLLSRKFTPDEYGQAVRDHWGVEMIHWSIDVLMGEDACQVRGRRAAANLSAVRKWIHNVVRSDDLKDTVRGRLMRASWDEAYMDKILGKMGT